jgi:hypothetical protein
MKLLFKPYSFAFLIFAFSLFSCSDQTEEDTSQPTIETTRDVSRTELKEITDLISQAQLDKASLKSKELLDQGIGLKSSLLWHLDGFANKELFKTTKENEFRSRAIFSLKNAVELDSANSITEQSIKALEYLSVSIYNDIAEIISDPDTFSIKRAENYLNEYQRTSKYFDSNSVKTSGKEIEILLAMSTAYRKLSEKSESDNFYFKAKQELCLKKVLEIDPENESALYSLSVLQYNKELD